MHKARCDRSQAGETDVVAPEWRGSSRDGWIARLPATSESTDRERKEKIRASVFALEMKPCLRKNTGHDQASLMMEEQGEERVIWDCDIKEPR